MNTRAWSALGDENAVTAAIVISLAEIAPLPGGAARTWRCQVALGQIRADAATELRPGVALDAAETKLGAPIRPEAAATYASRILAAAGDDGRYAAPLARVVIEPLEPLARALIERGAGMAAQQVLARCADMTPDHFGTWRSAAAIWRAWAATRARATASGVQLEVEDSDRGWPSLLAVGATAGALGQLERRASGWSLAVGFADDGDHDRLAERLTFAAERGLATSIVGERGVVSDGSRGAHRPELVARGVPADHRLGYANSYLGVRVHGIGSAKFGAQILIEIVAAFERSVSHEVAS